MGMSSEFKVISDVPKKYPYDLPPSTSTKIFRYNCQYVEKQLIKIHYLDYLKTCVSFRRLGYGSRTRAKGSLFES